MTPKRILQSFCPLFRYTMYIGMVRFEVLCPLYACVQVLPLHTHVQAAIYSISTLRNSLHTHAMSIYYTACMYKLRLVHVYTCTCYVLCHHICSDILVHPGPRQENTRGNGTKRDGIATLDDVPEDALSAGSLSQFHTHMRPYLWMEYPSATTAEINAIIQQKWKLLQTSRKDSTQQ